jgi:hypothetical protein
VLRHEFQPGKVVAGVVLTGTAVAFGGDARGLWTVPWMLVVPLIGGGLCLAGVVGAIGYAFQYRRRRARASGEQTAVSVTAGTPMAGTAAAGTAETGEPAAHGSSYGGSDQGASD